MCSIVVVLVCCTSCLFVVLRIRSLRSAFVHKAPLLRWYDKSCFQIIDPNHVLSRNFISLIWFVLIGSLCINTNNISMLYLA